jgi:hypothetical protein
LDVLAQNGALNGEAIRLLGARVEGARELGRLFLDKKLQAKLLPEVTAVLRKHATDPEVAKLLDAIRKNGRR